MAGAANLTLKTIAKMELALGNEIIVTPYLIQRRDEAKNVISSTFAREIPIGDRVVSIRRVRGGFLEIVDHDFIAHTGTSVIAPNM